MIQTYGKTFLSYIKNNNFPFAERSFRCLDILNILCFRVKTRNTSKFITFYFYSLFMDILNSVKDIHN